MKRVNSNKENFDIYIGRGSKYGNPFTHLPHLTNLIQVDSREEAISKYKNYILSKPDLIEDIKLNLKNKVLGCYCDEGLDCHGDILLELANSDNLIVGITGYRIEKCGGRSLPNPIYNKVCQNLDKLFNQLKPKEILSGMATGVDQFAAHIANKLNIPVIACVPFVGQEKYWSEEEKLIYHKLLNKSKNIVTVSEGGYSAYKYQIRNEYIVNNCDILIAVFSPNETSGGTFNCVQYAKKIDKPIIYVDPTI